MKKITLLAVAFIAISFASCKKDRVCTCKSSGVEVSKVTFTKAKKGDARAACLSSKYDNVVVNPFTGATTTTQVEITCELK